MEKCPIFNTVQARTKPIHISDVHKALARTYNMRYQERKQYFAEQGMYFQKVKEYYPVVTKLNKLYRMSDLTFYQQKYDDLLYNYFTETIIMRPRKNQPHPKRDQHKGRENESEPSGEL